MITSFKLYCETVEVTPNNTTGFAGDTSSTRDSNGFMQSGNDGNFGINFTPNTQISDLNKTYKFMRKKKRIFRKNKKTE